ncbi:MAG: hypothetical protein JNK72_17695 [Myxococcales bacterium]|nr:hypothetical protein [Myxococcales bacterium]
MKRPLTLALCLVSGLASAQPLADAAAPADAAPALPTSTSASGGCVTDPIAADHAPTMRVVVEPAQPKVGDRVLLRYQFRYRSRDRVEFAPDLVAFQQPGNEVEFAREQPARDLRGSPDGDGWVRSEVLVAVQPFRTGEVSFGAQRARISTGDEIARICTPPVQFRVQSPFGNTAHPAARDLTDPADVRRDALWLRHLALGLDGAFALVLGTLSLSAWSRRRPRPVAPPPPPRHPALVAIEALDAVAQGDLLSRGLIKDYYDAISDIVRRYLGSSRGFDAIEMTTDELLAHIKRAPLQGVTQVEIANLLGECDLVKFANYTPSHEESDAVLAAAVSLVRRGLPEPVPTERRP